MTIAYRTVRASGARYLELATTLLQQLRLRSATGGAWEAADVQWWSRQERTTDRAGQLFLLDAAGGPAGAIIVTDFGDSTQCDVLVMPDDPGLERAVWDAALRGMEALGPALGIPAPDDSPAAGQILTGAGFRPDGERIIASWLDAGSVPPVTALAAGYRLRSRADAGDRSHAMARRNGAQVAERLARCSLYRPDLDLMAEAPDGAVAGYGLFWADPVTGVGLIEPMRTEDAHQRLAIGRHVLTSGLVRLAATVYIRPAR